jgi:formylglycine-generating enzyme required for sulfatase activity
MREVLLNPDLGGVAEHRLQVLTNPGRMDMETAIEGFFANKERDDLLLLYFSGHGFRQDDRQLLLSTSQSNKVTRDGRTNVHRPTTLSARDVRAYMDCSRSRRMVVILDCCFSGAFALGMAVKKDEGTLAIEELLGGKGRAVLASSDAIETSQAAEEGEGLSVYTRFLVEGIQTGAAAGEGRDLLSSRDLHRYAAQRVGDLAPKMTPQFIHTEDGDLIRVCSVRRDPSVAYRQKVQELVENQAGLITVAGRAILDVLRQEIGVAVAGAERIEAEVLQPFRDYEAKLTRYRATLSATLEVRGNHPEKLTPQDREELQELGQRLKLRDTDVANIERELGFHQSESLPQRSKPQADPIAAAESRLAPPPAVKITHLESQERSLIQLPTTPAWLVREGKEWRKQEAAITVSGYKEALAEGVAIIMVQIPEGEFLMGSPPDEEGHFGNEGPQHRVRLQRFFLGQTPVTQAQWQVVAGWPKHERELTPDPSRFKGTNRPVEAVSWLDAIEFCKRLSRRSGMEYTLPSEAQWEYACRAGTTTPFHFGESISAELANYDATVSYGNGSQGVHLQRTTDVASFPANPWGLHDMHGKVWEWCADHWHDNYQGAPGDGSAWFAVNANKYTRRLLRGGSWYSPPQTCRSAYRRRPPPDARINALGFRVCCLPQD